MAKLAERNKDLREQYLNGKITADEYVNRTIINSKEGDRKRLSIERKFSSLLRSGGVFKSAFKPRT